MAWLIAALIAQFMLGTSAVFDRALLRRPHIDPNSYTFWLGVLGIFTLILLPFGFEMLAPRVMLEAFESGVYFIAAMYLLFAALSLGEASVVMMLVGAFTPIFTLLIGWPFGFAVLGRLELIGFAALVLGALLMFGAEDKRIRKIILFLSLVSAIFFALSTITAKIVYLNTNFINGFIWTRMFGFSCVSALLFIPVFRQGIFSSARTLGPKNKTFYLLNRGYASVASLLFAYTISLGNPALVEATGGFRYVVIFAFAWIVLRERFSGRILWAKIAASVFVIFGILVLAASSLIASVPAAKPLAFGATFSAHYAEKFGLDWQENYIALFDDLGIKHIRLPAYWHEIEPENNNFDFSRLDWQISEAEKRGADIILAVGYKLPRWPECHIPSWAREILISKHQFPNNIQIQNPNFQTELFEYIEAAINRYKNREVIKIWQIENEPFLPFGDGCPEFSSELLDREIALVKSLDNRPVMVTDSGELSIWIPAAKRADIFGSTLYRTIYNDWIGHFTYPIGPEFFRLKRAITEIFTGEKPMVVVELQGESWQKKMTYEVSVEEQYRSMNPEAFRELLSYIEGTGFDTFYLWGVEWWYWLKEKEGRPEMWDMAKEAVYNASAAK